MSPDFRDLLSTFNAHGVEYLVVGAYALAAHGRVRATGDLEVWIRPESLNAQRVMKALAEFGAPLQSLSTADLVQPGIVFQIGVAPLRIDILTSIDAVNWDDAWNTRVTTQYFDQSITVLSAAHLIRTKRAVGRTQDVADAEWLEGQERP